MSERYVRLFTLPENLYAEGAPVIIAAGTLLKDSLTNRIVAQLKMHSINPKVIKAVRVNLKLYDIAGNSFADGVDFEYLDLVVSRDSFFGSKTPIPIPNPKARSYSVSIQSVVFTDNTVWNIEHNEWNQLPVPTPLNVKLIDYELVKQYKLEYGSHCNYVPMESLDLWYCACGFWNHNGKKCHRCGNEFSTIDSSELERLSNKKRARLKAEEEQWEEEKRKKKEQQEQMKARVRKSAKPLAIVLGILLLIFMFKLYLIPEVILPIINMQRAEKMLNDGQYDKAIKLYDSLGDYSNASELAAEAKYQKASELQQNGSLDEALTIFKGLGEYKNAAEQVAEIKYMQAVLLSNQKKFDEAIKLFEELGEYKDCREKIFDTLCSKATYELDVGTLTGAAKTLDSLYEDYAGNSRLQDLQYQCAQLLLKNNRYDDAKEMFEKIDMFEDASELIKECDYHQAWIEYMDGKYDSAYTRYKTLIGYKNADKRRTKCTYAYALRKMREGEYEEAKALFEEIPEYMRAAEYIQDCQEHIENKNKKSISSPGISGGGRPSDSALY